MISLCLVFMLLILYDFTIFIATVLPNGWRVSEVAKGDLGESISTNQVHVVRRLAILCKFYNST